MEVVNLEDLPSAVEMCLRNIRRGVYAANQSGMTARMPAEVQFDVIVILPDGWQALEQVTTNTGKEKGSQGGGNTEETVSNDTQVSTQTGGTTTTETSKGKETSTGDEVSSTKAIDATITHSESRRDSVETSEQSETGTTSEYNIGSENGTRSETTERSSTENQVGRNTHVEGRDANETSTYSET